MIQYEKREALLTVTNLSVVLDGTRILDNINFVERDIIVSGRNQGQIISIVGPSGCGKSTLFNCIAGYIRPDKHNGIISGEILIGQEQQPVKLGDVGVVPQDYFIFQEQTVRNNLLLAIPKLPKNEQDRVINEYASFFGLMPHLDKYPSELSGGLRQRVSVLQQILVGNKLILLDEPFSGLDPLMKDKAIDLLVKVSLMDEQNTLLIVSHDIESSCAIADTIHVLRNDGNGANIVKSYDLLAENLAYHENVKDMPRFREIIREIKFHMKPLEKQ